MGRPRKYKTEEERRAGHNVASHRYYHSPKGQAVVTAWRASKPSSYFQSIRLKYSFGISLAEKDAMVEARGGCWACGSSTPKHKQGWAVDHCHDTDRIRGILCQPCNLAAGFLESNPERLVRLASYLGLAGTPLDGISAVLSLPV